MLIRLLTLALCITLSACSPEKEKGKHIFYLHGMIIETQGIHAVSEQFGPYEYTAVIDSLKATGAVVHSEVRNSDTDFEEFCRETSSQIDELVNKGVKPEDITVIGASKGGMMAMYISHLNPQPIKYVFLGASSPYAETTYNFELNGHILAIYESSDEIAPNNYDFWQNKSPGARSFRQLELHTGLGHGFFYRPIPDWLDPARDFISE